MADIIDLITADHRHIMIWQAELGEHGRQDTDAGRFRALASTWNTVACLVGLHMAAEDEILGPPMLAAGTWAPAQLREAADAHEDIREIICETSMQLPGSPLWWRLATAALAAWSGEAGRQEQRILPDFARRTGAAQREALCHQWRAFTEARIRDQIPGALPRAATCQLLFSVPVRPGCARPGPPR